MSNQEDTILTVANLTELIKITLKENIPNKLCITGEVSNYKLSKNNSFFTLKDTTSSINVAVWKNSCKNIDIISDGKEIKLWGNLVVYGKSGSYNLNAYKIELLGNGNLYQEYIKLRDYYFGLGYFDEDKKKRLPSIINKVGVATALGGAALQDFLCVIKKNNFNGTIYIKNCIVQGKDCPASVVKAIKELDDMGQLDIILITRGGGGYEDLCGFSDPLIIEALHNCKTCTISAIGHEVDFMLSDFTADIRAPTPSYAGQIVAGKKDGMFDIDQAIDLQNKINNMLVIKLKFLEYDLTNITNKLKSPIEIITKQLNDIQSVKNQLANMINKKMNYMENDLHKISQIDNPNSIFSQGYCVVYSVEGNQLTNMNDFNFATRMKKKLKIKFIDGNVSFDVRNITINK